MFFAGCTDDIGKARSVNAGKMTRGRSEQRWKMKAAMIGSVNKAEAGMMTMLRKNKEVKGKEKEEKRKEGKRREERRRREGKEKRREKGKLRGARQRPR
jgi:hypothetical protein